ncbi:MAG: UDP-N-acetylmuramate dehydrogenase [Candidatus Thioglobus sp.]|jgi:UDP-N-acetylmuramate dehydrogenase
MSGYCSFRTGGLAQDFFTPNSIEDLSEFLKNNQKSILMLGLGSNLLVRDRGFDGVVIKLSNFKTLNLKNSIVEAGAGVTLAKIARFCEGEKLSGGEFLSAIPGSVGGALAMNAGAFGSEIWDFVHSVNTINSSGTLFHRMKKDYKIGYRQVIAKNDGEYFIGANLKFEQATKQNNIKELLEKRNQLQPIGLPSCGSVFKNPTNQHAAKLIEKSNLKGFCIGGACVSNKHANFIINQDDASATDIENLIFHIQQTVKSKFGIDLETEVKIV